MTDLLPGQPELDGEPVFREPWEAHAFAMAVRLHEQGLFTWPEWAAVLAEEIARAQSAGDPDTGDSYYHHWLAALERPRDYVRWMLIEGVAEGGDMLAERARREPAFLAGFTRVCEGGGVELYRAQ